MDNQEKSKKKFYESCWFWAIVVFVFLVIIGSINSNKKGDKSELPTSSYQAPQTSQLQLPSQANQLQIPSKTSQLQLPSQANQLQIPSQTNISAQSELDDLMATSKKADLIQSYEFSDSATVVYVTNVWNTQTVQFKKDFMAKIGMLKNQITGYTHFEVRNAYTDEKVGEITAFMGELKVYK